MNDRNAAEPEEHQIADPDPAVQVHRFLTVIPPAGVKASLHKKACHVFQCSANQEGERKGGAVAGFKVGKAPNDYGYQRGATTIDGQDRPS